LFCLAERDETNIIASLVGRSLGFRRVVTQIEDPEFEHICIELGLEDTIVPSQTIGRYLAEMVSGQDILELSAMVRGDVRFFAFVAGGDEAGPVEALNLPRRSRVIYLYRRDRFHIVDCDTVLETEDEVVLVTHREEFGKLMERWGGRLKISNARAQHGAHAHKEESVPE
jgi:trk system potassium uptake protein TrkA